MNEWTRSFCCLRTLFRWLCDWSSAVCICGVEYDSVWHPIRNWGCYQNCLTETHPLSLIHWHKHSKQAFSLFLPPLKPSRSKSVKLEVDEDKSTKGSNFPPSEVTIGLSPYTFPQEWPFHVPGEENIDWRVSAWQNHYTPISSAATEVRALQ